MMIKGSIYKENRIIINVCAYYNLASIYTMEKWLTAEQGNTRLFQNYNWRI